MYCTLLSVLMWTFSRGSTLSTSSFHSAASTLDSITDSGFDSSLFCSYKKWWSIAGWMWIFGAKLQISISIRRGAWGAKSCKSTEKCQQLRNHKGNRKDQKNLHFWMKPQKHFFEIVQIIKSPCLFQSTSENTYLTENK